eukprot:COSAG03_NODE_434_length_7933_cov_12.379755_3_plen_85_part_00
MVLALGFFGKAGTGLFVVLALGFFGKAGTGLFVVLALGFLVSIQRSSDPAMSAIQRSSDPACRFVIFCTAYVSTCHHRLPHSEA